MQASPIHYSVFHTPSSIIHHHPTSKSAPSRRLSSKKGYPLLPRMKSAATIIAIIRNPPLQDAGRHTENTGSHREHSSLMIKASIAAIRLTRAKAREWKVKIMRTWRTFRVTTHGTQRPAEQDRETRRLTRAYARPRLCRAWDRGRGGRG